jgi:hypothetical protein
MSRTTAPVRQRRSEALALRVSGMTYQAIGDLFGITAQSVKAMTFPSTVVIAAVKERAGGRCERCGKPLPVRGHVHHRTIRVEVDTYNHPSNLLFLCASCHAKEHKPRPVDWRERKRAYMREYMRGYSRRNREVFNARQREYQRKRRAAQRECAS